MRVSENRYSRDVRRLNLGLRLVRLQARTGTIRTWTGLTADRIRHLYQQYASELADAGIRRPRGSSPMRTTAFFKPRLNAEAAALAGLYGTLGVIPLRMRDSAHARADRLESAERLCTAFLIFRRLTPLASMSIEQAFLLATAVTEGNEIVMERCGRCGGVMVSELASLRKPLCGHCREDC